MGKRQSIPNSLFEFLHTEAKRKADKKRRLILLVAGFLIGIGGFYVVFLSKEEEPSSRDLPLVPFEELDSQKVGVILADQPDGFLTKDSKTGLSDTIRSVENYKKFAGFQRQGSYRPVDMDTIVVTLSPEKKARLKEQKPDATILPEDSTHRLTQYESTLPSIDLQIEGEHKEGSPLVFTIPNYNPNWWYILEYGNGTRLRIKKMHTFTYEESGDYTLKVTAIHKQSARHIDLICKLEILSSV